MLAIEGARRVVPEPHALRRRRRPRRSIWRQAVAHLQKVDPKLARVIDAAGAATALELKKTPSLFGALAEAIVYQQLTGKAAATIYASRLRALPAGARRADGEHILRVGDDAAARRRALGARRCSALQATSRRREQAARSRPSPRPHAWTTRRSSSAWSQVRGIGRWTAEMLLIFRLGRPDVLPVDDYGVRKGFMLAYKKRELPTLEGARSARRALAAVIGRCASWYCWRALEI